MDGWNVKPETSGFLVNRRILWGKNALRGDTEQSGSNRSGCFGGAAGTAVSAETRS